jgi:imidazolonepropionase-like amidohydrolase
MRRYLFHSSIVTLAVVAVLDAQPPAPPAQEPLALINGRMIDVSAGTLTRNATLVLRGGKIESVGGQAPASGIRVIDLAGKYVLPGLIDAHTHLANVRSARVALESGVTTVRSAGTSNYADVGLRELARKGVIAGPDVIAAGYHVRPRVADEAFLSDPDLSDLFFTPIDTVERIRRIVRVNLSHGVDVIKILATERAGTPETDPRIQIYGEAEIKAAVDEAATKNTPVLAHAHGDEGAMAAVKAGVRSIEHGTYLSDATLRLMKERGTYFVPTYTTVVDIGEPGGDYDDPGLRIRGAHMLPRLRQSVQSAIKLGVRIVTGGDTSYGPNSLTRLGQEMANFVALGMTPLQAIQSATLVNAELLRLDKTTAQLRPGMEADLIAVEGNPLENILVVQDPLLVISNGRIGLNRLGVAKGTR